MQRNTTPGLVITILILMLYSLWPDVQLGSPGSCGCNGTAEKAPPDSAFSQYDNIHQFAVIQPTVVFRSTSTSGGELILKC